MFDLAQWYGNDLSVGATGDLLPVDGIDRGRQRVLRRLLTNPGDYIWHPGYGAGLPLYVGQPAPAELIQAIVRQQIALEASVAKSPPATITVSPDPLGTLVVRIIYIDADTGQSVSLSFDINR